MCAFRITATCKQAAETERLPVGRSREQCPSCTQQEEISRTQFLFGITSKYQSQYGAGDVKWLVSGNSVDVYSRVPYESCVCFQISGLSCSIARAEPDGTRTETTFHLSPKRTSPFKSVGASVQSTAGSRGVRISLSNAG